MRILLVANGFPPDDRGGVETYTRALSLTLRSRGHQVSVLCRAADPTQPDHTWSDHTEAGLQVRRVVNNFSRVDGFASYYYNREVEAIFADCLRDWQPDVLHFQHAIGLSASLPLRARAEGWPAVWTLWDYWPICPLNTLLLPDRSLCPGSHHDVNCFRCVFHTAGPLPGQHIPALDADPRPRGRHSPKQHAAGVVLRAASAARRVLPLPVRQRLLRAYDGLQRARGRAAQAAGGARSQPEATEDRSALAASRFRAAFMRSALEACDALIAPLPFVKDIYSEFGVSSERMRVMEPGMDLTAWRQAERQPRVSGEPVRLGYVGSLMRHKGLDVVLAALRLIEEASIELRVHGFFVPGDPYAAKLRRLAKADPRVRFLGPYQQHELPSILAQIDVLVVPSVWHETFSFVTREAILASVPIFASRMGGMRMAVEDGVNGLLLPPGDVPAWAEAIRRAVQEPGLLERMSANQRGRPVRSIEADAADLEGLYAEVADRARLRA